MNDSDDDTPQLSAHAMAALKEFYAEQLQAQDSEETEIKEDWQLSQFWYDDETAEKLAKEAIRCAGKCGRIACLSTPTIYKKLIEIKPEEITAHLFEFDKRFAVYKSDFIFFDYNEPLNGLTQEMKESYDIILLDPPFLYEDCLQKMSIAAKFLAKEKIILLTGAVMEEFAHSLLKMKTSQFKPKHANNLANEFSCYSNYDIDQYL